MNTVKHKKALLYLSEKWNCSEKEAIRKLCEMEYNLRGYPSNFLEKTSQAELVRIFDNIISDLEIIRKGGYTINRVNLPTSTIHEETPTSPLLELFE